MNNKKNLKYILVKLIFLSPVFMNLSNGSSTISNINITDGFDFPVGKPDAKGYYNAQKFGVRNKNFGNNYHLGEDWNGINGGNSDFGDPVYTSANGVVTYTNKASPAWGNVVRIIHKLPDNYKYKNLESVYAHLSRMNVEEGDHVKRGQKIGEIGNAGGLYYAHLHFELRYLIDMPLGGGYSKSIKGYLSPTLWIRRNRPVDSANFRR